MSLDDWLRRRLEPANFIFDHDDPDGPFAGAVEFVLSDAVRKGATAIRLVDEGDGVGMLVVYTIDGVDHPITRQPRLLHVAMVRRLAVLARSSYRRVPRVCVLTRVVDRPGAEPVTARYDYRVGLPDTLSPIVITLTPKTARTDRALPLSGILPKT